MFLIAAQELANFVEPSDIERGSLYPPLSSIRDVSMNIAIGVTKCAYDKGLLRDWITLLNPNCIYNEFFFVVRLGIHIPRATGQAQVAGGSAVQLQLRVLDAGDLDMAPHALHKDSWISAHQTLWKKKY